MNNRSLRAIEVSPIGMGCMGLSHGYGEIPPEQYSIEAIQRACDYGCTFFDTAEAYGPNMLPENIGHNERIVGKALAAHRHDVVIATKLHLPTAEGERDGLYTTIRRHLEASLQRLGTDYVDLYYLHRVNRDFAMVDVAEAFGRLINEGLIRGWGLSQVDVDTIAAAHAVTPLSAVQNIYSMLERGIEAEVIPFCKAHGIGVVPFSPIASGLLSGRVTAQTNFSHSDDVRKFVPQLRCKNIEGNRPILDLLAEYAGRKQTTPAQISLVWMLYKWDNVVPIPGSKNQERIIENLGAWNVSLTADEFTALDNALTALPVHGYRGFVEFQGGTMADWGKK